MTEILDLDKVINSEEVSRKRKEIEGVIQNSSIEVLDSAEWFWICPKCQSEETCAYRWIFNENATKLIEANDNLEMKLQ